MKIAVGRLTERLAQKTAWQKTPMPITELQYYEMIREAIKTLYIDTSRVYEYEDIAEQLENAYEYELKIDEEKYVLLCAQIEFFKKVQSDVNNIVSYTTDALSITSADKPYVHLQDTIQKLDNERRIVFYKMNRYAYDEDE